MPDVQATNEEPEVPNLPKTENWHLDKKVPIAMIVAIFVQFMLGVWYAGQLNARIEQMIEKDKQVDVSLAALNSGREQNASRITVLEAQNVSIYQRLTRIEDKLDLVVEKLSK